MGWQRDLYEGLRPLLFAADTEWIHGSTVTLVRKVGEGSYGRSFLGHLAHDGPSQAWTAIRPAQHMGMWFRNPVGLGAGFDKDGEALAGWGALGLGFAELGTVTVQAQPGNPRPRLWRLPDDDALVNRMGFNNPGAAALAARVARARPFLPPHFVVGVSIGRGATTTDGAAAEDYRAALALVAPVADYVALNVSSPNTTGLASLQDPARLVTLVEALASVEPTRPLVVKLSADLDQGRVLELADALAPTSVAGLILSNTTTARTGLRSPIPPGADRGGLSGRPLLAGMLSAIGSVRGHSADRYTLVASGGILGRADAQQAMDAGADLIQLWTGIVFSGPGLIGEVVDAVTSRVS